ncbi:MAG: hypothetical protein K9M75_06005 [Phycisphaerae bacterium]|nr:hypothetical protein [Phycisphaerae bacterium]
MLTSVKITVFGAVYFGLVLGGSVFACGPDFPNRLLIGGDNVVFKAPETNFYKEITSIKPPYEPVFKAVNRGRVQYAVFNVNADVADLADALAGTGLSEKSRQVVVDQYRSAREKLLQFQNARTEWQFFRDAKTKPPKPLAEPKFVVPVLPKEVPAEFADYYSGAAYYHMSQNNKAQEAWSRLLRRPKKDRHYRSTWATFMLGRMMHDKPRSAIKYYKAVRQLAGDGFADSIGLAAASYGWQGRMLLDMKRYDEAVELYLVQKATGDKTALMSLSFAARDCFANPDASVYAKMADNKIARQVMTAYVITRRFNKADTLRWLDAVRKANVLNFEETDRLALAAYQAGEIDLAIRWLDTGREDTNLGKWLRAKLLLYDGKVEQAAKLLAGIVPEFPAASIPIVDDYQKQFIDRRVRGELGVLYLARRQYVESLDVLIAGGYWEDAAYVAERVLTPQELIEYVDLKWPPVKGQIDERILQPWKYGDPDWFSVRIRYLLARRLSRLGMFDKANEYYPPKWQKRLDIYLLALSDGEDNGKSRTLRASKLWKAACITRYEGMELFGTEVAPDWYYYGGHFDREPLHYFRGSDEYARLTYPKRKRNLSGQFENSKVVPVSKDEQKKIQMHTITPELRFHYRYKAVDLAWRASKLMDDQSDETARVLCIAGSWMVGRDQEAADRFYKSMVRRCGTTELGKEADKLRWFPKIEIDKDKLLE